METRLLAEVVVLNRQGQILLLRRSASDSRRPGQWDVPGGHRDGQESLEAAAQRECREETGISLQPQQLQLAYAETAAVSDNLNVVWLYFVARCAEEPAVRLSKEHDDYRWVDAAAAVEMIDYDRQRQALAYLKSQHLLG